MTSGRLCPSVAVITEPTFFCCNKPPANCNVRAETNRQSLEKACFWLISLLPVCKLLEILQENRHVLSSPSCCCLQKEILHYGPCTLAYFLLPTACLSWPRPIKRLRLLVQLRSRETGRQMKRADVSRRAASAHGFVTHCASFLFKKSEGSSRGVIVFI